MENLNDSSTSWKNARGMKDSKLLIDRGIMMSWRDIKPLKKKLKGQEEESLARHFAVRLAERTESRLAEEILIESLLIFLANDYNSKAMDAFIEELFLHPNHHAGTTLLVELAITSTYVNVEHSQDIYAMAVALICEIGLSIQEIERQAPGTLENPRRILDHVATYLLSVSNSSNNCIRLSLLHYFGATETGAAFKPGFNRIMSRFGHTVLEHLFALLFHKKTEAVALQYLLDNIPFILEADNHSQKILHETWKHYMLKHPERFSLFIHALGDLLQKQEHMQQARIIFLQHLGMLLRVASDVNHRDLGREIAQSLSMHRHDPYYAELVALLSQDHTLRPTFKELVAKVEHTDGRSRIDELNGFRSSKRGRKPSFSRAGDLNTLHQVIFLGHRESA